MIPMDWLLTLNRSFFPVVLFTALFANRKMIRSTSVAEVPLVLSCLCISTASTAAFEQVSVLVAVSCAVC